MDCALLEGMQVEFLHGSKGVFLRGRFCLGLYGDEEFRKVLEIERRLIGHYYRVLDGGAEFPHVSGPPVALQEGEGLVVKGLVGPPVLGREFLQEGVREEDDVLRPGAERGHGDGDDVEPEEETSEEDTSEEDLNL